MTRIALFLQSKGMSQPVFNLRHLMLFEQSSRHARIKRIASRKWTPLAIGQRVGWIPETI